MSSQALAKAVGMRWVLNSVALCNHCQHQGKQWPGRICNCYINNDLTQHRPWNHENIGSFYKWTLNWNQSGREHLCFVSTSISWFTNQGSAPRTVTAPAWLSAREGDMLTRGWAWGVQRRDAHSTQAWPDHLIWWPRMWDSSLHCHSCMSLCLVYSSMKQRTVTFVLTVSHKDVRNGHV